MSVPVGTLLSARYRLEERIGHGGMSTVYRSFDVVLERQVAIKLMHREIATESDQLERFRREARAVAQLNHPHIVTVIDAGDDGDPAFPTPYIVFEYVDGETLKDRIRRLGGLPIPEAVAYTIEIARALGAAHDHQIIHRDVKPQNVLIDPEGSAKITDFGIARTLTEQGLTADGRVLGTTDYVSPEQALGHAVTPQSDLYSLGVVLYEMLTGDVPFTGETPVVVAMKHVREELPDVQGRRAHVSAALASVVDRATAKDLSRRYRDSASMVGELEEVLAIEASRAGQATGEATTVLRTLPGSARRRLPFTLRRPEGLLAALLIVAAAVAALVWYGLHHTHRGTGVAATTKVPAQLTADSLGQGAAHAYNPYGTGPEHAQYAGLAIDGDPSTAWTTEHYNSGLAKPGTGLYLDAKPGVAATRLEVQTTTPGLSIAVLGANTVPSFSYYTPLNTPMAALGWGTPLGTSASVDSGDQIPLSTAGVRYRYYLVWITKLPPGSPSASLNELTLLAPKGRVASAAGATGSG